AQRRDGESYLAQALSGARDVYEFVFLDSPPSLGPLTVNALAAADEVLVPVQAEDYALERLTQLVRSAERVRAGPTSRLRGGGVLVPVVHARTGPSAEVEKEVRSHSGPAVSRATIPRWVPRAEAPARGLPVTAYDRQSAGAEAYWRVANELV